MRLTENQLRKVIRSVIKEARQSEWEIQQQVLNWKGPDEKMAEREHLDKLDRAAEKRFAREKKSEINQAVKKMLAAGCWTDDDAHGWLDDNGYSIPVKSKYGNFELTPEGHAIEAAFLEAIELEKEKMMRWQQEQDFEEEYGSDRRIEYQNDEEREAAAEMSDYIKRYGDDG